MNLVDSSGWLEYFIEGTNASFFAAAIEDSDHLICSSISIFEVFRMVLSNRDENAALSAIAAMQTARVIDIDTGLATMGAKFCVEYGLTPTDALVLATARSLEATLWTQKASFQQIQGVRYITK